MLFALSDRFSEFLQTTQGVLQSLEGLRDTSLSQHVKWTNLINLERKISEFIDSYFFTPQLIQTLKHGSRSSSIDATAGANGTSGAATVVDVDFVMVYLPELE